MEVKDPRAVKFVLLHPFIALILSHHSSAETSKIGWAVSGALDIYYGQLGKTYEDVKKNPDKLIEYIILASKHYNVPIVEEKLKEQLKEGLPKALKIIDKLLPDNSKEHAKILQDAFSYKVNNPLQILRNAGIDIEPELEEFRQFLAEISGKKMEPKERPKVGNLESVKLEVLSVLQALEFANYSEEAKRKAIQKLSSKIKELSRREPSREVLLEIGFYAYAIELIKGGRYEMMAKIKKL